MTDKRLQRELTATIVDTCERCDLGGVVLPQLALQRMPILQCDFDGDQQFAFLERFHDVSEGLRLLCPIERRPIRVGCEKNDRHVDLTTNGRRRLDAIPFAPEADVHENNVGAFTRDEGWVSVGIDHDTASFAVQAIRRWWRVMGRPVYRHAQSLLITADAGGSNGARLRLWKWELQRLANRTGLTITVCHFPPGTSKWNKIQHRLFSHIAMNWHGTPLVNLATIVSLIGATHSRSELRVRSELDRGHYPSGVAVADAQMATVRLERHRFHGDWNYTIHPATTR